MPPYGEPDWATPGDTTNTSTVSAGVLAPVTAAGGGSNNATTGSTSAAS